MSIQRERPVGLLPPTISRHPDEDTGENATASPTMLEDPVPQFIDPDTGTIHHAGSTMRTRRHAGHHGWTTASPRSPTPLLEILILDANDNAPALSAGFLSGLRLRTPRPPASSRSLPTSRDSGPNGRLLYTFQGGDDGDGDFYIEAHVGRDPHPAPAGPGECGGGHNLRALAVDRGQPVSERLGGNQASLDINDSPPVFEKDELELFVENGPVGSVVARIRAKRLTKAPAQIAMPNLIEQRARGLSSWTCWRGPAGPDGAGLPEVRQAAFGGCRPRQRPW